MNEEYRYWQGRKRLSRRSFVRGAAIAGGGLTAAALVGCGGDDSAAPTTAATAAPGGTGPAATATVDAAAPRSGGTFRVRLVGDPPGFNIGRAAANRSAVTSLNYNWLTTLKLGPGVGYRESTIVPDAAVAMPELPDEETYIFRLRPEVHFANVAPVNGRQVTAEDVVETTLFIADSYRNDWRGFASVEATDDQTVVIKTDGPYAPLLNNLSGQYGVVLAPKELVGTDELANRPVGSGPYNFERFEEGSRVVQRRNPDYWNPEAAAYIDEIQFLTIPESGSAIAAYRAGDLDWLTGHSCQDAEDLARSLPAGHQTAPIPGTSGWWSMNTSIEPFNDIRVRQAVARLYNRERDTNALFCGNADVPGIVPAAEMIHPTQYPDADRWLTRDVQDARQLLAAAGYPNGFDTNLDWTPHYGQTYQSQMEGMVGDLREGGINATMISHEYGTWIESVYRPPYNFTGICGGATGRYYPDPDGYVAYWLHPSGIANQSRVNDPRLTELVEKQVTQINPEERWETLNEIALYEFEQQYYVWRHTGVVDSYIQPWVRDFNPHGSYTQRDALPAWIDA